MWNLKIIDTNKSLYIALADALERDIRAGVLQPGDRLPSHRDLAKSVGVTGILRQRQTLTIGGRGSRSWTSVFVVMVRSYREPSQSW